MKWDGWSKLASLTTAAAAVGALWYTGLSLRASQEQFQDQFRLAEQGQFTDRFGRAIDQLGSPNRDVRLGGIYSLGQLERDSPSDSGTIIEVLATYVRTHAPRTCIRKLPTRDWSAPTYDVAPDVQAAITIIGQRKASSVRPVDLSRVCLGGVDLGSANLDRIDFSATNLDAANLTGARLNWAKLYFAKLTEAKLDSTELQYAYIQSADLSGASLVRANLSGNTISNTSFRDADLSGANLARLRIADGMKGGEFVVPTTMARAWARSADFSDARIAELDLSYAFLRDANFSRVDFTDAKLDHANLKGANLSGAKGYAR